MSRPLNEKNEVRKTGMYGKHHTEETKLLISDKNKGRHFINTEETKTKKSESKKRNKNPNWIGGIVEDTQGYIETKIPEGCRFSCMKQENGYIKMHRLIMAEYLQRPLRGEEVVHHKNEIRSDNRIENLKLLDNTGIHTILHKTKVVM